MLGRPSAEDCIHLSLVLGYPDLEDQASSLLAIISALIQQKSEPKPKGLVSNPLFSRQLQARASTSCDWRMRFLNQLMWWFWCWLGFFICFGLVLFLDRLVFWQIRTMKWLNLVTIITTWNITKEVKGAEPPNISLPYQIGEQIT